MGQGNQKAFKTEVRSDGEDFELPEAAVRIDELVKHFGLDAANAVEDELYATASPGI